MRRRPLVGKLFPTFLATSFVSILILAVFSALVLTNYQHAKTQDELVTIARLIAHTLRNKSTLTDTNTLRQTINGLATAANARITVIATSGNVLADSEADASTMQNHADRPEVQMALSGRIGISKRKSATLGSVMYYVAVPVTYNEQVKAVVRIARLANATDVTRTTLLAEVVIASIVITLLASVLSWIAARRIARPLSELQKTASAFARGDFRYRAPTYDISELATLADSLNSMSARIENQIRDLENQAAIQSAILSSMKEAVLAIGEDDKVLIANESCRHLLKIDPQSALGRPFEEVIRHPALNRLIEQLRKEAEPAPEQQVFETESGVILRTSYSILRDSQGRKLGILLVFSDVTEARKIEKMRRDFVANVSHELKTPITAIKGYLETILEFDNVNQEKAREFLQTALRQTDRLNAIIDDLLKLSEIEQKTEEAAIELEIAPIKPLLEVSAATCEPIASEKQTQIEIQCAEDLTAPMNVPLLERAVTNLIDNAIKYSPEKSHVMVLAERTNGEVAIRVIDNGPGIPAEHIPRIFERFYRVDTARSRRLGGTGLGLAIVKHVAQAHRGRVDVVSKVGEGSTFSIYLPLTNSAESQKPQDA